MFALIPSQISTPSGGEALGVQGGAGSVRVAYGRIRPWSGVSGCGFGSFLCVREPNQQRRFVMTFFNKHF